MRRRKYKLSELELEWEAYKKLCQVNTRVVSDFSAKSERRVLSEVPAPHPPTISGFLIHLGMARRSWYDVYTPLYPDFCERVRDECEVLNLKAFMTGEAPASLAPLVMATYGWSKDKKDDTGEGITVRMSSSLDGLDS